MAALTNIGMSCDLDASLRLPQHMSVGDRSLPAQFDFPYSPTPMKQNLLLCRPFINVLAWMSVSTSTVTLSPLRLH